MIVPLVGRGRLLGTLTLVRTDAERKYTEADLRLAEELAARAALEADNARLYGEERKAHQAAQRASGRMARLQAATAAFSRALTPAQVAEAIVREGGWLLGNRAGAVTLFAYEAAALEPDERRRPWIPLPAEVGAQVREAVWADSFQALQAAQPALAATLPGQIPGAVAVLPLTMEGRLMGVVAVRYDETRSFDTAEREFFLALAGLCAQALDRARLYQAEQRARAEAQALNARLEERVARRTKQLLDANTLLVSEVAERKQAQAQLNASQGQLRNLATRLQSVREAERARFAHEIHDEFGQSMTGLKMDIAWLHRNLENAAPDVLREKAVSAMGHIDEAIHTVRRIAVELRPGILDDLGLVAAIEWQTREFENLTGIRCKLSISAGDLRLDPASETAAFRIFQDILSNVRRHALASRVVITLHEIDGHMLLAVRDNGRGITQVQVNSPEAMGLIGMRELAHSRGGRLEISGKAGKGTTVTLRMPLKGEVE
jgi:signal transduction histidine kinase